MRKLSFKRRQKGQAIVEYVILVVVIALAAFFVLTAFSDRLRELVNGTTTTLGGESNTDHSSSKDLVQSLTEDGE